MTRQDLADQLRMFRTIDIGEIENITASGDIENVLGNLETAIQTLTEIRELLDDTYDELDGEGWN